MAEDFSLERLARLLSASQLAEQKNVRVNVVRKAAREGTIPGAVEILGRIGFDPDLVAGWTPPEGSQRQVREDGRRKYWVWCTDAEFAEVVELGYEGEDPRLAAKARRAARKAKKDASTDVAEDTDTEGDPFEDFGA